MEPDSPDRPIRATALIVVHLAGGLGNQLFQYAFGRRMALRNDAPLVVDATGYDETRPLDPLLGERRLELHHFGVQCSILRRLHQPELPQWWIRRRIRKYWSRLAAIVDRSRPYHLRRVVIEPEANHFKFDGLIAQRRISGRVDFYGYWQTERYFADIESTIRDELRVVESMDSKSQELAREIADSESVGIHVRHGDNAGAAAAFGVLPPEYYQTALRQLRQDIAWPRCFVFSDDIDWARSMLRLSESTTYMVHNQERRDYEDLRLMSLCRHHIIANSTFGWWGAWLGKNDSQIVYAPRRYYQNIDRPNPDLYPEQWRIL